MTDTEFIDFMGELLMAPDTVIKKAHMKRMLWIFRERVCCMPGNDWGHTPDCPRWFKDAYASLEIRMDNVKKELEAANYQMAMDRAASERKVIILTEGHEWGFCEECKRIKELEGGEK